MNEIPLLNGLGGARKISAAEAENIDLGPLTQLMGTWKSASISPTMIAQGWNTISVPGPHGFVFEVIPYTETLTFTPAIIAANKGPFVNGTEVIQQITGLIYEQAIFSACPPDKPCNTNFPEGVQIHAETGLLLNTGNPDGSFDIARLSTIPHGNSVLALGNSNISKNPGNDFFPKASTVPTNLDGSAITHLGFGYAEAITNPPGQFPNILNQADPNTFLKAALGDNVITDLTTLVMNTNNKDAGGGILNIPFIQANATATSLEAIFWIETLEGNPQLQLQYTQTINLVFPPTGTAIPVVWPHVTVNTLTKVA